MQSTETTSSVAMELEGLKRCREELENVCVSVASMTTDQHLSIAKYIREDWKEIVHYYDTWHIAKGMSTQAIMVIIMRR